MKKVFAVFGFVMAVGGLSGFATAQTLLAKGPQPEAASLSLPEPATGLVSTTMLQPEAAAAPAARRIVGPEMFFRSTPANFSKAVLKFGAVTLDDSRMLDDYARIAYCDLARRYISNEFEWAKIRSGIRKSVDLEKDSYPYRFVYTDQIRLGNYDFSLKGFPFSRDTPLKGIGNIVIEGGVENECIGSQGLAAFPTRYRIVFAKPVTLDMLPMVQADGERLLSRMKARGNNRRIVYIRFNFEVKDVQVSDILTDANFNTGPVTANFQSRLYGIDFFEDKDEKVLLGSWTPRN